MKIDQAMISGMLAQMIGPPNPCLEHDRGELVRHLTHQMTRQMKRVVAIEARLETLDTEHDDLHKQLDANRAELHAIRKDCLHWSCTAGRCNLCGLTQ